MERYLSKNEESSLVLSRKDASDRVDCEREGRQLLQRRCVPGPLSAPVTVTRSVPCVCFSEDPGESERKDKR